MSAETRGLVSPQMTSNMNKARSVPALHMTPMHLFFFSAERGTEGNTDGAFWQSIHCCTSSSARQMPCLSPAALCMNNSCLPPYGPENTQPTGCDSDKTANSYPGWDLTSRNTGCGRGPNFILLQFEKNSWKLLLLTVTVWIVSAGLRHEKTLEGRKKPWTDCTCVTVGIKCSPALLTTPHTLDENPSLENK